MTTKEIVLFSSSDGMVSLSVPMDDNTVWLSQKQMAELFNKDQSVINRHIKNAILEGEIENSPQYANFAYCEKNTFGTKRNVVYSLDVIISVGYRVHSPRGVEFRRWATRVLKDYIVKGYAVNVKRIRQLGQAVEVMKRVSNSLDADQILDVVQTYSAALDLLDDYDHQCIDDGNKRIAAGLFLYFLSRNKLMFRRDGSKRVADHTLVALTVMIAESRPEEKEMMVNLVMNFLA